MVEALERVVDPVGAEQRQRFGLARRRAVGAIRDRIVDHAHVGQGEGCLQSGDPIRAQIRRALLNDERQRHATVADPDDHRHAVVLEQQRDLAPVVFPKEGGPGQRRPVDARIVQGAERASGIEVQGLPVHLDAEERVAGIDRAEAVGGLAGGKAGERVAHDSDVPVID